MCTYGWGWGTTTFRKAFLVQ
jgi:hypothetical protein